MRDRCLNPRSTNWSKYGGRGVTICERWNIYQYFLTDMGRKPTPRHSIDRIDPDRGYEPANCRWATIAEQNARGRRRWGRHKPKPEQQQT